MGHQIGFCLDENELTNEKIKIESKEQKGYKISYLTEVVNTNVLISKFSADF